MDRSIRSALGFSLVDMMMAVAIGATMAAIAVPAASRTVDSMKLSAATRDVERELQTARLRAVSLNRPVRVRLNCPSSGSLRVIEITGVAATDTASNRCDMSAFPYPGPSDTNAATPSGDGPVRTLHSSVTMSGNDLQFSSRGTASQVVSGTLQPITTPVSVTVAREGSTASIEVNSLGKIKIQ